ncbi:hypothetical protein D3C87_1900160 [compost metagenome]
MNTRAERLHSGRHDRQTFGIHYVATIGIPLNGASDDLRVFFTYDLFEKNLRCCSQEEFIRRIGDFQNLAFVVGHIERNIPAEIFRSDWPYGKQHFNTPVA